MATATAKENISHDAVDVNTTPIVRQSLSPRNVSPGRFTRLRSTSPTITTSSISFGSPNRLNQIPLQKCFVELNYMSQLLAEIERKDRALLYALQSVSREEMAREEREDSSERPSEIQSSVAAYQDFVNSFISLLLQSKFLAFNRGVEPQQDPHNIIRNLVTFRQCPDFCLFKRVAVDPTLVASGLPEDENPAIYKNIPVNQLARFCDIAVLRFLSTVNEHTSTQSVIWALDYLQNLLNSLITSLNSMSSFGWYAAPSIRIKKGTILSGRGVNYPPHPPLPPVVVHSPDNPSHIDMAFNMEYTPSGLDSILDPETGQRNPTPSPPYQSPQPQHRSAATGKGPPNSSGSLLDADSHQGGGVGEGERQRRISREEKATFLMIHRTNSPPERSPERSPSPSQRGSGISPASSLSGDSLPLPFQYASTSPNRRLSPCASPTFRPSLTGMEPIPEENKTNEDLGMDLAERDYFLDIIAEIGPPVPPQDYLQPQPPPPPPVGSPRLSLSDTRPTLRSIQEEDEELAPVELERSSPVILSRSPSPGLGDDQLSDTASSLGAGEEDTVRSKPLSLLPPLELKDAPKFDAQKELDVLMNGEGRVSLIAILQAIATLPQSQDLWTEDLCLKCFSLIQLCMNLGLTQADEPSEALSAQDRRKQFQKRENVAFQKHGTEKPFKIHSRFVVEYSVKALIHCASNMITGCTNDNGFCRLSYKHLPNQNRIIYDKLIRNLRRLHLHSSACFRQALTRFATMTSCQKLFHFLHVVLQYCLQGEHLRLDSLMVAIVASVLRTAVDRLVELDIRERAIQNSIMAEACYFFQYAQTIFSQDSLMKTQTFRHLHMYIHRIALSVILPPRPHKPELPNSPGLAVPEMENNSPSIPLPPERKTDTLALIPLPPERKMDTLPHKRPRHAATVDERSRGRAESLPIASSGGVKTGEATASQQRSKARRGQLTKQESVHHDPDALVLEGGMPKLNAPGMEWRGLRLDLLRSRVQRLVVLMETSEPGTMPDAGMLASLIDLGDGMSVVARAMVFLECALFVGNLRSQEWPLWVTHNRERCSNVAIHLRRWGEAIGEKLRITELHEREMINRRQAISHSAGGSIVLPEEPLFPDDNERSTNFEGEERTEPIEWTVSYALKMAACILLLEITRFLRDPPPQFASGVSISPQVSAVHLDRKTSNTSVISSDFENARTLHPGNFRPTLERPLSDYPIHHGSSLSVEEPEFHDVKSYSFDEQGTAAPRKRRVSVYLHINKNRSNSVRRQTVVRFVDSPSEVRPARSHPPSLHGRRQSLSTGAGGAGGGQQFHLGGSMRSRPVRRPTLASGAASSTVGTYHPQPLKYRRKSASAILSKTLAFPEGEARPPLLSQSSTVSNKGAGGLGNSLNLGFSKLKRSAKAFRRNIIRKKTDAPTPGTDASSPNMTQHKRLQQQRLSQMGSSSQVLLFPEDRRQYPWLDIMEHLILVDAFDQEGRRRHKKACLELVTILKAVYVDETVEEDISIEQTDNKRSSRTLSSIFAGPLLLAGVVQEQSVPSSSGRHSVPVNLGAARRRSNNKTAAARSTSAPATHLLQTSTSARGPGAVNVNPLATLRFTNLNYARFTSSFLAATSQNEEGSIELFLEEESAFTRAHISKEFNQQRREYLKASFSNLMHAPFSLLVHAAPILHTSTFNNLKEVAWNMLLDSDHETAKSAGAFFLLVCAKESDVMVKRFVSDQVIKAGPVKQREALQRFMVLWHTRYHVWPRMEERAQKKFHMFSENDKEDSQDQQSIGYSLPANLLGSSGAAIPLAPWEPVSVCTGTTCDDNPDKCFRPTRLAPVLHPDDISKQVNTYSVSGVSVPQEASTKPANVYYGVGSEDSTGNINDIQWEAVEPTLFPRSLLPLIHFVITSLGLHSSRNKVPSSSSSSSSPSSTTQDPHISELARQAVWTCMVEDSRLFFRPLLNQFNKLYKLISSKKSGSSDHQVDHLLAEILKPLHMVLQAFPSLPPRAAHFLFNNFVGIIMRHTDQPYTHSAKIIQSVLTLIGMVVPCVQGLDSKLLKSILKKENCYTTIMTTARIRGVEKVHVMKEHSPLDRKSYEVGDDMTFGQLIADGLDENLSVELLQNWYLVDEGKDLPLLSSLVVQDHYSVPGDGQYPTFIVRQAGQRERMWNKQLEQLFVHKMSEVMRVAFTTQLLLTGPEVEKGFTYSEFAQPNYRFVHTELVELNSFPRKALTSILYEVGPTALQHGNLRASDIILKGMWVRFVLQLFRSIKQDYDWSNSMILFLNVVNGALLLHSENYTILRFCLASVLTAAGKFNAIFKQDGYQMIVPTLIQVYALHMQNSLVTNALKFTWCQLYLLDSNIFLLQAIAATATLLSEEAYILSSNVNSTFTAISQTSQTMEGEAAQRLHAKAVFELLEALNEELPPDELDILACCPQMVDQDGRPRLNPENRQRFSLQNTFSLCVTLATWNPEALRGMQVLVFLDRLMPLFLMAFTSTSSSTFLPNSMKYLIKGCEAINKRTQGWKGDTHKGGGRGPVLGGPTSKPYAPADRGEGGGGSKPESRRTSVIALQQVRKLINPKKKEFSSKMRMSEGSVYYPRAKHVQAPTSSLVPIDHRAYVGEFKLHRIQDVNQRVLKLSRESLLSLSSQFVLHSAGGELQGKVGVGRKESTSRQERPRVVLDAQAVLVLTAIAIQLLRQGEKNNEIILQGKGLNSYMSILLPSLDWSEPYYSSFNNLIARINKLFKKLHDEPNKALLVWDNLATFITGIAHCIQRSPQLVVGHEQHLSKLKALLEMIVGMTSDHSQKDAFKGMHRHLLHNASASFSDAVVKLAAELIVVTRHCTNPKFRYRISDLLSQRLTLKELPKDIILHKILLPLCIQLGLREETGCPSEEDVGYMLQFVYKDVENVLKLASNTGHPCQVQPLELFFRELKVICCAFAEVFTLFHWHKVAQWVLSLSQRKFASSVGKKISTISISNDQGSTNRWSRHSSTSSTPGSSLLNNFIAFHNSLLNFFESFLLVYRVPLFSLLWPLLGQMESQLITTLQNIKADTPALCDKIHSCIDRYRSLQARGSDAPSSMSRNILLREFQEELKHLSSATKTMGRSHTTVEKKRRPILRRRGSASLSNIGEVHEEGEALLRLSPPKTKAEEPPRKNLEARPTFLRLVTQPPSSEQQEPSEKKARAFQPHTLPKQQHKRLGPLRRNQRKRSPVTPGDASPSQSPVAPRRRPPPLAQLRGIGSSERHADTEDFDSVSPEDNVKMFPPKPTQLTVLAEVHEPQPRSADSVYSCSEGHDQLDTPGTLLLPTHDTAISTQSSFSQTESYDVLSETDGLLRRRAATPVERRTSRNKVSPIQARKKSLSLDRKQLSVGFKELGTGIKSESSPSVKYRSLKDITGDDTEC